MDEILKTGFSELSLAYDDKAVERFRIYADYLTEINKVMNLTAIEGDDNIARLHFLDCAALFGLADFKGRSVIDIGTGAGFPGMPLKIVEPDIRLTLLDSLDKRINFLKNTCEKLGLDDVCCLHSRAEEAPGEMRGAYDYAVSRAVARLTILCELCLPFVKKGGAFIAMKSTDHAEELAEAEKCIRILGGKLEKVVDYRIPGTDIIHSAIIIRKISPSPEKYPRRWALIKKAPL